MAEYVMRRGQKPVAVQHGDIVVWPGGVGTIQATFPVQVFADIGDDDASMTPMLELPDVSISASDGGTRNFLLPDTTSLGFVVEQANRANTFYISWTANA